MNLIPQNFSPYFERILAFLRVRSAAVGLEITDEVVRIVAYRGGVWQLHAMRLEPGVVEAGAIKKRDAFVAALGGLREKMGVNGSGEKINVVLVLGSAQIYTQIFSLPLVQGDTLEQAVALNLQMASPLDEGDAYSGWQVAGRNESTYQTEILGAFVSRKVVDDAAEALFAAGFVTMAVESRALALTRVLGEKAAGVEPSKSYVFVNVDNTGIDFLIIRNGALYFEYATPWKDIMDEKGNIPIEKFQEVLAANTRQVMNFYNQHWQDPVGAIILSAVAFEEQSAKVIAENALVPSVRLSLIMGQPISSEWLVALGASLRGLAFKGREQEVNLLGDDSRDRFREEQFIRFLSFWRLVIPLALCLLVAILGGADIFLMSTSKNIEERSDFQTGGGQAAEIAALEDTAGTFNKSLALVSSVEHMARPKYVILEAIGDIAAPKRVTISKLSFSTYDAPVALSGTAFAEDSVLAFKTALEADPRFTKINLPLTGVQRNGNTVTFSMTFFFAPSAGGAQAPIPG